MAVYFVAPESRRAVQIGYARDVNARLRALQNATSEPLVLLGCIEGGTALRTQVHQLFASSRLHGDWFRLTKALQAYVDEHCTAASVLTAKSRGRAKKDPKYRLHRASGQALVEINGYRKYLGEYGSEESMQRYRQIVAEWKSNPLTTATVTVKAAVGLTIAEAMVKYFRYAQGYYQKDGKATSELHGIRSALRFVRALYETTPAAEFSPLALKAVRQQMIEAGLARPTINQHLFRIRKMFKWLAAEEAISAQVWQSLAVVDGLRKGRTSAQEPQPVRPVNDALVEATLPHLPEVVADMVRLQRLLGCRPAEICVVRPCDVDRSGSIWIYRPESHKTQHHGHDRTIFVGPRAQAILLRYLARGSDVYCFQPCDSESKRRAAAHAARVTPLSCGNRPGSNVVRHKPRRSAGERYTTAAYGRAVARACKKAFSLPASVVGDEALLKQWRRDHHWAPNQLRHSAATEIRKRFGLEAAQYVLGHAKTNMTELYAEKNLSLAAQVAREVG